MKKAKIIGALLAVFLSGAIVGSVVATGVVRRAVRTRIESGPDELAARMMKRVKRRLNLSEAQAGAIKPILIDLHKQHFALLVNSHSDRKQINDEVLAKIEGYLNDAQREKLQRLRVERRAMFAKKLNAFGYSIEALGE